MTAFVLHFGHPAAGVSDAGGSIPVADALLLLVLVVAGLGSVVLVGLGFAAFVRRGSRSFLLVALALATLLARTVVAGLAAVGTLPSFEHHLFEHTLDVAMVALVIGAVYYARTAREPGVERP